MGLDQTFYSGPPRADLIKKDFDTLIHQKGRDVVLETALQCPCKSESTNQQSNCKNCGGTGWVFINPRQTRMVLTAIDIVNEFRPWSEELRGTVNITAHVEDELSIMDRITALDGESIHNEVLFLKQKGSTIFSFSTYDIKKILYIGMFKSTSEPLIRLKEGEHFTIEKNKIIFITSSFPFQEIAQNNFTIRYLHAPQFHVIEMKRDTMQSYLWSSQQEVNQNMPVSAVARRSHFQLSAQNLNGDRLLDNSYQDNICEQ